MLRTLHAAGVVRLEPEPPPLHAAGGEAAESGVAGDRQGPNRRSRRQAIAAAKRTALAQSMIVNALRTSTQPTGTGPVTVDDSDRQAAAGVPSGAGLPHRADEGLLRLP